MRALMAMSLAAALIAANAFGEEARDAEFLADVINQRLETQRTGAEVPWMNPSTGNGGVIVILETDVSDPDRPCRTYRRTLEQPGGPTVVVEGSACRVAEALWQRSESAAAAVAGPDPAPVVEREPPEPPPSIPPPLHKPDPDVFFASVPTPSVY